MFFLENVMLVVFFGFGEMYLFCWIVELGFSFCLNGWFLIKLLGVLEEDIFLISGLLEGMGLIIIFLGLGLVWFLIRVLFIFESINIINNILI